MHALYLPLGSVRQRWGRCFRGGGGRWGCRATFGTWSSASRTCSASSASTQTSAGPSWRRVHNSIHNLSLNKERGDELSQPSTGSEWSEASRMWPYILTPPSRITGPHYAEKFLCHTSYKCLVCQWMPWYKFTVLIFHWLWLGCQRSKDPKIKELCCSFLGAQNIPTLRRTLYRRRYLNDA